MAERESVYISKDVGWAFIANSSAWLEQWNTAASWLQNGSTDPYLYIIRSFAIGLEFMKSAICLIFRFFFYWEGSDGHIKRRFGPWWPGLVRGMSLFDSFVYYLEIPPALMALMTSTCHPEFSRSFVLGCPQTLPLPPSTSHDKRRGLDANNVTFFYCIFLLCEKIAVTFSLAKQET